jgi:hypothetical protein
MSTFRINKRENPFVQIDKTMIHDNRISFKAKGILAYLLSRPNDWQVYEVEIVKHAKDGRESVRSGIKELIEAGYIERYMKRGEKGKFEGYEYLVYETPDRDGFHHVGKPDNGKTDTTNNDLTNNELNNNYKNIYLISDENEVFSYYSQKFKEKFGKDHPTMNEEKMDELRSNYYDLTSSLDIDEEQWIDAVDYHFDYLSPKNNGNILAFLGRNGGHSPVYRYLEDMAE